MLSKSISLICLLALASSGMAATMDIPVGMDTWIRDSEGNGAARLQMKPDSTRPKAVLLWFDVSVVPDQITGAELLIKTDSTHGTSYVIDWTELLAEWTEDDATGVARTATENWSTQNLAEGVDYGATVVSQINVDTPGDIGYKSGAFSAVLAEGWRDGSIPNYGIRGVHNLSGNDRYFSSKEEANSGDPEGAILRVTYVPEPASMSLLGLGALALIRRRR